MTKPLCSIHFVTLSVVFTQTLWSVTALAASDTDRRPSETLTRPGGVSASLLGGGVAFNADLSAIDGNPAGLALNRTVTAGTEFFWQDKYANAVDLGIIDSKMSQISAAILARQTTEHTGGIDRRYSLGFAGRPSELPLFIGIAGDYMQVKTPNLSQPSEDDKTVAYKSLRLGGIYQVDPELQFGLRTAGYFSDPQVLEHTAGVAFGFAENYIATADLGVLDDTLRTARFGLTVLAKTFLDLSVAYGYDLEERINAGALGIVVKSDMVRVYYTGAKSNLSQPEIAHSVGARLGIEF